MKKVVLSLLVAVILCGGSLSCLDWNGTPQAQTGDIVFATDYDSVYAALMAIMDKNVVTPDSGQVSLSTLFSGFATRAPLVSDSAKGGSAENSNPSYSSTNVQVQGIDEADIVKTDGKYIYVLQNDKVTIYKADGMNTTRVSAFELSTGDEKFGYKPYYTSEMYICGKYLVVLAHEDGYARYLSSTYGYWGSGKQLSSVCIYDVSVPSSPKFIRTLGQDGVLLSSRLLGNTLYLVTSYYTYSLDKERPESYVPATYVDGVETLIAPGCIAIMPNGEATQFTVVSAIDIPSGTIKATQTMLGGGTTVYMSEKNLYIAGNEYKYDSIVKGMGLYDVTEYESYNVVNFTRIDISDGKLSIAAYGCAPGNLLNQFSMDEYKSYFRVVTTSNVNKWTTYSDGIFGFFGTSTGHSFESTNGLYIFDMSLNIVGSVDNLAPDERVYSVRFDADMGYFVTFRQVDPLFAVDLSKPNEPKILSELKIPGFSEYLHVFSDGLLFGLGYDADVNTGWVTTMKLSMFDTNDPRNVFEAHTSLIGANYSSAMHNHKAILINATKNIICFPADGDYLVYGYDATSGFFLRVRIVINGNYYWNPDSRGLFIGEFFYVVANDSITVVDLGSFKVLGVVS